MEILIASNNYITHKSQSFKNLTKKEKYNPDLSIKCIAENASSCHLIGEHLSHVTT